LAKIEYWRLELMAQTIQTVAALLALLLAVISCWFNYKTIPKDRAVEIKSEAIKIKNTLIFFVTSALIIAVFLIEALSTEPLTRIAVAKMCIAASIFIFWIIINLLVIILSNMLAQSKTASDHFKVTKLLAEHISENSR
jgi:hypothetical protein